MPRRRGRSERVSNDVALTLLWTTRSEIAAAAALLAPTLADRVPELSDDDLDALAARVRERYFALWHPAISVAVAPEDVLLRRAAIRFGDVFRAQAQRPASAPAPAPEEPRTPVLQLTRAQLVRGLELAEKPTAELVASLPLEELRTQGLAAREYLDPSVWPRALVCALAHVLGAPQPELPEPQASTRVERILNTIADGAVWGWDDAGEFFSPSVHRLAGAPVDTDALTLWNDIIHPDDYPAFAQASPDEEIEVEYRVLGLDGVTRCVLDRTWVERLPDGTVFVKGLAYDITRRRSAEEALRHAHADLAAMHAALREAHEQVARLVETIDEVLWTATFDPKDATGTQMYVSPSLERLLGGPMPEDVTSAREAWYDAVHPDDRQIADAARRDTRAGRGGTAEYRVRGATGEERWVLDRRRVATLGDGRIQVCGSLTDVTERRRMEEELLRNTGLPERASVPGPAAARPPRSRHLHVVRDP